MRYSGWRIFKEALTGHKGWTAAWRDPAPQPAYDYVIVGGGGHGLATAYYLAREFKQARIAVLEKSYLGSGNVGRNTTIIRSNYLLDGNEPFYEFSLKLWEGLEQDFNFNAMVVAARHPEPDPHRCAARCLYPARQWHDPAWGRRRDV